MKDETLEKSCIKATKDLLKNYRNIKHFIEYTEKNLANLKVIDRSTVGSIRYDEDRISPTNNISKSTEVKAVNIISDEMEMQIELYKNKKIIETIDAAINNLPPVYKDVIKYKYIEGLQWAYIVDKLSYEERALRTKRNEAVKNIACELFGVEALQQEDEYTIFNYMKCIGD